MKNKKKAPLFFFFFCYGVKLELRIVSLNTNQPTHREEICEKEKKEEKKKKDGATRPAAQGNVTIVAVS